MAADWFRNLKEVDGIKLDNYFLHKSDLYSAEFIHKKFLKYYKDTGEKKNKKKKEKVDKSAQNLKSKKNKPVQDSLLQQTVNFAKSLVPTALPPSRDRSPVFYMIKTSKKHKKKSKPERHSLDKQDRIKTKRETKEMKVRDSLNDVDPSSESNTLDDLNQSMTCTVSELSEPKHKKKTEDTKLKTTNINYEPVEVIEHFTEDPKIKALVMNENDINTLAESIQRPILNTLKEYFNGIKDSATKNDIHLLQTHLICNTQKLDNILITLACIEKKIDAHIEKTVVRDIVKSSKLEELSEDVLKEESSSEEELQAVDRDSSEVVEFIYKGNRNKDNLGCGEVQEKKFSASVGVKTERPNRIPARFCWTDVDKKS